MSIWKSVSGEFRLNYGSLKRLIPVIAIMFIPILYAGTYLYAFWDPYGNTNTLPVAVVNLDTGATDNGKHIDVGKQLVDNLKSNTSFHWDFVSESQAGAGMKNNQYFMELRIPPNFSEQTVASAKDNGAVKPELTAVTSDEFNFVGSLMGKNAAESLREQTAQNIAQTYAENLVTGVNQLEDGIRKAANGASDIANGTTKLGSNVASLSSGAAKVESGSDSVLAGINQADLGAAKVAQGTSALYQGTTKLNTGLESLVQSGNILGQGANSALQGLQQLQSGLGQSQAGAAQTAQGASQLEAGLEQLSASDPLLAANPQFQALLEASKQVAQGSGQVASSQAQLLSGADKLVTGQQSVASGIHQYVAGVRSAQQGSGQLVSQEPALVTGAQNVAQGLGSLRAGAAELSSASGELDSGVGQFGGGLLKLEQGAESMNGSLQQAEKSMPAVNSKQMVSATSNPVILNHINEGNVPNYGYGLAPYFLSLALFVGTLVMSIIVDFRVPARRPASGMSWFLSKLAVLLSVGVAQSLILDWILVKGLGISVPNVADFVWFTLLLDVAYIAILQFLVTVFGNPGRFVGIILLVLQLTSSGGTFPLQVSPKVYQHISPYVPMTYSVQGFRYLMFGGYQPYIHKDILILAMYAAAFLCLTSLYFLYRFRREAFYAPGARAPESVDGHATAV